MNAALLSSGRLYQSGGFDCVAPHGRHRSKRSTEEALANVNAGTALDDFAHLALLAAEEPARPK